MRLAARGLRDLDHGTEPVADPADVARLRRQARAVYMKSVIVTAVLTAITWWM